MTPQPLPDRQKYDDISNLSVHLDTAVTALDGQTDGRTKSVKQYRAVHALHA